MKKLIFFLRIIVILDVLARIIFSIPLAIFYLTTKARNKYITTEDQIRLATKEFMYLFTTMLLSFILFLIENPPATQRGTKMTITGIISLLCIFMMLPLAKKISPEARKEKKYDKNVLSKEQCDTMHQIFLNQNQETKNQTSETYA